MSERLENRILLRLQAELKERTLWWKGEWWPANRFLALVEICETNLRESGFDEGQRLVLLLPNCPLVLALSMAAWRLKGAVAPLNLQSGAAAIAENLGVLDPWGVVMPSGMESLDEAIRAAGHSTFVCQLDEPIQKSVGIKGNPDLAETAVVFSTSGTTGTPKAVIITHSNLLDNTTRVFEFVEELRKDDVFLNVLPNFHTLGYSVSGILPLTTGLPQAIIPGFMPPQNAIEAIREACVTVMVAVPTMVALTLATAAKGADIGKCLRVIICGGDRLNPNFDKRARETMNLSILEGYGLTECSPVVTVNPCLARRKLGTVGPFLPGYESRVLDREGNEVETGQDGVLWVKGASVTPGYFRSPEKTAERFRDGWFNTGDIVRVDADGYVTILDRDTDILIVGGFNVYPQEVERVLQEHPAIHMAAVIGIQHPVSGEIPKAFVILKENETVSQRELVQFCKEKLAHYKVPRKIEFVASFPLSPAGKVLRRKLREMEKQASTVSLS
ncbi:MAG: AMP-binding protein [Synergistales bacterium]